MEKRTNWFEEFLTNNYRFNKSDILFRKVYMLNAVLVIMMAAWLFFVIADIALFKMFSFAAVNAVSFFFTLAILIYFKKTNNYKPAAYGAVILIMICLIVFFEIVQNQHYSFYWIAALPPISYFLLDRKAARISMILFGGYMLYFIIANSTGWQPAIFRVESVFNIAGATICIAYVLACFEKIRTEVWDELNKTIMQLEDSKNDLRLILDTSAEAIYGIDLNGNCTFCNNSCLKMLGYDDQSELLGKNMHWLIHYDRRDGSHLPEEECIIFNAVKKGEGAHVDDEVFWRADGTSFDVEYFSYPQIKNDKIIGAVITFMDITERKQTEEEIQYLNCYDNLTGLHNRRCFEANIKKIDIPENLPLSVIFADANGLKLTNDIFGHSAGDELIKKSAEILKKVCRQDDAIARVGGDEFIILLPKTDAGKAAEILSDINEEFVDARVEAIKCSISLGHDTKIIPSQPLDTIIANAENAMYKDKTMHRKSVNKDIIQTIIWTLHSRNPVEKQHSVNVSDLCYSVGVALDLPETEIDKLRRSGFLHDIGKIVLNENLLTKASLTEEELEKIQQHSAVGYRILSLFDETLDLAEYVYSHHERWDGSGYPNGIKGEQIPLISRIIAVAETYDRVLHRGDLPLKDRKQIAISVIKNGAGTQFDRNIAESFIRIVES